jgi:stage II sporulation protein P
MCVFSVFFLAGFISTSKFELLGVKINEDVEATDVLLRLISYESAVIGTSLNAENHDFPFAQKGFEMLTNIQIDDVRSLVRNELPGFYHFDYDILIAGEGTDFTDNPMESSPPLDVLLKEREMASNELEELNKDGTKPPDGANLSEKKIFIYHTHSWESYLPLLGLEGANNENESVDGKTNITIIGDLLGTQLENKGIGTSVDKTNVGQELKNRGWKTSKAYQFSRSIVETALSSNNKPEYLIDLHRDSLRKDSTTVDINQKPYAKVVFVIGKDNQNYAKNIQFASEIHEYLRVNFPGLSKGVLGKSGHGVDGVYNQDLSPNSVVIEVGGVDNNMKELKNTVEALADAISHQYFKAEEVQADS